GFCTWWCGPQRRNPAASARGGYLLHGAADLLVTLGIFGIPLCETDCAGPARALQNARRVSPVREFGCHARAPHFRRAGVRRLRSVVLDCRHRTQISRRTPRTTVPERGE